jgi:4-amino-4-deoxy-L-arabinose transferase-like glycosyltransferase
MKAANRKKVKPDKKKKSSNKISQDKAPVLSEVPRSQFIFKYIFSCLLLIYLLFYLFKLFSSLGETFFWADENTHAFISSLIAENHQLPARLPDDIYGGFVWSYPPLFHILAGGVLSVAGFAALKYMNLVLLLLFFICFYFLILKYYGQNEAVIACLLISLSPALAINSIRFMTDMLSMFLIFFSVFFFFKAIEKNDFLHATLSGLSTGFLLLSKQTGIIVLSFYGLLLLWFLWKDKTCAKTILYIIGVSLVIYIPYLGWGLYHKIDASGFLYYFFGNMPEWAKEAVESFRRYDSSPKEFAYLFYTGAGPIITISFLIPIYYMIKSRAKVLSYNLVFALLIYLMLAMSAWHITNSRHMLSLLPILALLVGYASIKSFHKETVIRIFIVLLFIVSAYTAYKMPNYREKYNVPKEFFTIAQKIKDNGSNDDGRVFTINAFDVLMYSQKPVIWPYPNLGDIPIELFEKHNSQEFYALLKKYNIRYILVNMVFVRDTDAYFGRNYPLHFMRNCEILDRQGKLALEAISKSRQWILLKII